jgi:hypothetical protein
MQQQLQSAWCEVCMYVGTLMNEIAQSRQQKQAVSYQPVRSKSPCPMPYADRQ